jgi:hypothetical protein
MTFKFDSDSNLFGMRGLFKGKKDGAKKGDYIGAYELYTVDTTDLRTASVITSFANTWVGGERYHQPVLDLDGEHYYIPSSTPGHAHLYLNCEPIPWELYCKLLDVMAECGILEPKYVDVSKRKGYTAVRLPWVKKETDE